MNCEASADSGPTKLVGGVPFCVTDMQSATNWLLDRAMAGGRGINVRLANAFNVALANQDPGYGNLMIHSGINFPDGTPIVWAMNLRRGAPRARRVRGPSFFKSVIEAGVSKQTRHFFLGSTPETLDAMIRNLTQAYPDLLISGTYSPPFATVDEAFLSECVKEVKSSASSDIVWVGLGTPKQDHVGTSLAAQLNTVTVNVGAAFDFAAGTVPEAPIWVQNSGFEWLYRLVSEPRRLWRRYLIGNVQFMVALLRSGLLRRSATER